jgi:hypothetical protein
MSHYYIEFKKELIDARFTTTKCAFKYLEILEKRVQQQNQADSDFDNDSLHPIFDVLYGKFLSPNSSINDFKELKKRVAPKLLMIMNALARAAVEKYIKQIGFNDLNKFYGEYKEIIDEYYICIGENQDKTQHKGNPLDINRYFRNEFLHWEVTDFKDTTVDKTFKIEKKGSEILFQRVTIYFEIKNNDTEIDTYFDDKKGQGRGIQVHEKLLIKNIKYPHYNAFLTAYFAEYLLWLLDLIFFRIDNI